MEIKIPVPSEILPYTQRISMVAKILREKEKEYPALMDGLERVTRLDRMGKYELVYLITYEIPLSDED